MIYITGDTHGELDPFLKRLDKYELTSDDTVIVCGDFGFVWGDPYHNAMLKELSGKDFTICFVDGNHENFEFLNMHPVEENGKSFFAFGGAYSRDKYMRRKNVSWWEEELPTNEEYKEAVFNLESVGNHVDYVLTHQIPLHIIGALQCNPDPHDRELTGFLDWLYLDKLSFRQWFAGHWHINRSFDDGKMNILLDEVANV